MPVHWSGWLALCAVCVAGGGRIRQINGIRENRNLKRSPSPTYYLIQCMIYHDATDTVLSYVHPVILVPLAPEGASYRKS